MDIRLLRAQSKMTKNLESPLMPSSEFPACIFIWTIEEPKSPEFLGKLVSHLFNIISRVRVYCRIVFFLNNNETTTDFDGVIRTYLPHAKIRDRGYFMSF